MQEFFNKLEQHEFMRSLFGGLFIKLSGRVLQAEQSRWYSADTISHDVMYCKKFRVQLSTFETMELDEDSDQILQTQCFW